MRILIRTSKWAIWSRRFGSLALPLAVIPVFMHREALISSADFSIVESVAVGVALLALVLAFGAFIRLWISGDRGWGKAFLGLFFSLVCLAPFALMVWMTTRYPDVADVSTDFEQPPGLVSEVRAIRPTPELQAEVEAAFPNARNRTFPIEAAQMFGVVQALVEDRGWDIVAAREPQSALAEGQLNAIAMTFLGWREEVAIRVAGDAQGSVVAMRSVSLNGGHDLGENGRRVEEFMVALDQRVTQLMRNAATAPAETPAE